MPWPPASYATNPIAGKAMGLPGGRGSPIERRDRGRLAQDGPGDGPSESGRCHTRGAAKVPYLLAAEDELRGESHPPTRAGARPSAHVSPSARPSSSFGSMLVVEPGAVSTTYKRTKAPDARRSPPSLGDGHMT
jgi:hypothetical protein